MNAETRAIEHGGRPAPQTPSANTHQWAATAVVRLAIVVIVLDNTIP